MGIGNGGGGGGGGGGGQAAVHENSKLEQLSLLKIGALLMQKDSWSASL